MRVDQPSELVDRCLAVSTVLAADAVYGSFTAAQLYGWWLPTLPPRMPLCVIVDPNASQPRRDGVRGRRAAIPAGGRRRIGGVAVTSPLLTLRHLAEDLGVLDLTVVLDAALHRGDCSLEGLAYLAKQRGGRGIRSLREAVELADRRSESAWETVLRLVHVFGGMPEVDPQENVFDDQDRWLARADLRLRGTRRLHEYDGATHRDAARHRSDLARDKRLQRARYERYGYTAPEIMKAPERVIRDAEDGFGLDHDAGRLSGWLDRLDGSLFTAAGRRQFARRWGLM